MPITQTFTPPRCEKPGCNALKTLDFMHGAFKMLRQGQIPSQSILGEVRICAACVANIAAAYGSLLNLIEAANNEVIQTLAAERNV